MEYKNTRQPVLQMKNIRKSFSGVQVLSEVNFEVCAGEIVAIIGQNGAGKSTLMKILAGVYPFGAYDGEIILGNSSCRFSDVRMAERSGIFMIQQEVEIFPNLSVTENLYFNQLGDKPIIDWNSLYARAERDLQAFGLQNIRPRETMLNLTRAQHQLILITKALILSQEQRRSCILILDEPTSSLSEDETRILFHHLEHIRESGVACLYISHRFKEVFEIANRTAGRESEKDHGRPDPEGNRMAARQRLQLHRPYFNARLPGRGLLHEPG